MKDISRNLTMLCDFYELTMANGYFKTGMAVAAEAGVPMVNYGVAIAQMHGILKKSLEPFPESAKLLEE